MTEQQPDGGDLTTLRELEAAAAASLQQCEAAATEARNALAAIREAREAAEGPTPPATARERAHRRWGIITLLPLGGVAVWRAFRHHPAALFAAAGAATTAAGVGLIAVAPWEDDRPQRPPAAIATVTHRTTPPTATITTGTTATAVPPSSTPTPEPAEPLDTETSPIPEDDARGWASTASPPPRRHTTVPRPTPSPPPGPIPTVDPDAGPGSDWPLLCVHVPPLLDVCL